jgi:hypothetical protein
VKPVRSSSAGFSLLEVMIAGGIMAFFAMVLLQVNELQSHMITTNEAQMEEFTLLFQVQQVLADPVSCSISVGQAFGKVTDLRDLAGKPPAKLPALYRAYKNVLGHYESVKFLSPGQTIGSGVLRIHEISVAPRSTFDGQLDVVLSIERLKKGILGGTMVQKRIPINVDLIGPGYANAFDGIMCLNPAQAITTPDVARRMGAAIDSALGGGSGDSGGGSAEETTTKALVKACIDTGGVWVEKEHRCGVAMPTEDTTALRSACDAAGGQWDDAGRHCNVAAH